MHRILIASCVVLIALDFTKAQEDAMSLYTKRYEHLDVDTILASPRLVSNYVECLLNRKPCPPEGKALKRILPEALRTKCGRCLPSQKEGALKVITALHYKYPQSYKELRERWDPTGEYHRRFQEYLRDQKFNSIGSNGGDTDSGDQLQGSTTNVNITQRPIRQDDTNSPVGGVNTDEIEPDMTNRFGTATDDDNGYKYEIPPNLGGGSTSSSGSFNRPSTPSPQIPTYLATPSSPTASWQTNGHYPPPVHTTSATHNLNTQNPVLNIINRITMKFANTADFIATMLRATIPKRY